MSQNIINPERAAQIHIWAALEELDKALSRSHGDSILLGKVSDHLTKANVLLDGLNINNGDHEDVKS